MEQLVISDEIKAAHRKWAAAEIEVPYDQYDPLYKKAKRKADRYFKILNNLCEDAGLRTILVCDQLRKPLVLRVNNL